MPSVTSSIYISLFICTILSFQFQTAHGAPLERFPQLSRRELLSFLKHMIKVLEDQEHKESYQKRKLDYGYGSRYGIAKSVGSKLMALKQAADWNGPGKK